MARLALDDAGLFFYAGTTTQAHQVHRSQNWRERISQLMAQHGQKLILGAIGNFSGLASPRQVGDFKRHYGDALNAAIGLEHRLVDEVKEALFGDTRAAASQVDAQRAAAAGFGVAIDIVEQI